MTADKKRIGQALPVPTAEELTAAQVTFQRVEARGLFYKVAVELVESALEGRSRVSLAEAVAVLLQTWNQSFYRYRGFDEQHFSDLEVLLKSFRESLASYRQRGISSLTNQDEAPVNEVFTAFENLLGPVGAAKCLHLLAPRFFPLWDRAIAERYGLALGRTGHNARKYWLFMQAIKEQVRQLEGSFTGGNLLKALDEYNYCVYTRGLSLGHPPVHPGHAPAQDNPEHAPPAEDRRTPGQSSQGTEHAYEIAEELMEPAQASSSGGSGRGREEAEAAFDKAMVEIYRRAKAECGYSARRFLEMVTDLGGVAAAKKLLASDDIQYGFTHLWECGRLELTVEAHVLLPEFAGLFSPQERRRARNRLLEHGFLGRRE